MQRFRKSRSGFSLVEIVIAIGITAFTLAAIGGIFGVSSQSAQDSSRDTLMTSMIAQVTGDLRSVPFDALWNKDPRGYTPTYLTKLANAAVPAPPSGTPAVSTYYFTAEGTMIVQPTPPTTLPPSATSFTASPPYSVYRCQVTKTVDAATQNFGSTPTTTAGYNRLQLILRFDWPAPSGQPLDAIIGPTPDPNDKTKPIYGPNTKLVYESIARCF